LEVNEEEEEKVRVYVVVVVVVRAVLFRKELVLRVSFRCRAGRGKLQWI